MAFRGLKGVSPETREAIFEAAKELGYRHNAMAARLAAGRTNTVGLFLLDIHNEVFADIFTGLRTQEESMGSKVVLAVGNPAAKTELEEINNLLNVRVEALILAGSLLPDKAIIDIARAVPTVAVTRLVPGVRSVAIDDRRGAQLAVEHLIGLGHKRIAYIAPPTGMLYKDRETGYRSVLEREGLAAQLVVGAFEYDESIEIARTVLINESDRPTAIFANNDLAAFAVLEAAARLGISVPDQLSVIGFDDTRMAAIPGVQLTTVSQQAVRQGEVAAELATEGVQDGSEIPRHVLLEPSLIVRKSTATVPS